MKESAIILLSAALIISVAWNFMLWYSQKVLLDHINKLNEPEKEHENPNQLKLNLQTDGDEENHH